MMSKPDSQIEQISFRSAFSVSEVDSKSYRQSLHSLYLPYFDLRSDLESHSWVKFINLNVGGDSRHKSPHHKASKLVNI
jgi:heme oxygenase